MFKLYLNSHQTCFRRIIHVTIVDNAAMPKKTQQQYRWLESFCINMAVSNDVLRSSLSMYDESQGSFSVS